MSRPLLIFAMLFFCPLAMGLENPHTKVNVDKDIIAICPIDDCYLTLVDETLCDFIDKIFDTRVLTFSNTRNCIEEDNNSYLCLNVLARKKFSEERQTYYSDPYVLQLMTDFHVRLDRCLSGWQKEISLQQNRQEIIYQSDKAKVSLILSAYDVENIPYDRLILELHQYF